MVNIVKKIIKKISRKISKTHGTQLTLAWALSIYLKFVYKTSSWKILGLEETNKLVSSSPIIACFWHGRMAMIPFMWHWPEKRIVALISAHSDGIVVAKTFQRLNIDYVSGSTNKEGVKAFRALLDVLANQNVVGIIPDGPRGPSRKASEGIIYLAKHSKAPIMPIAYATSRFITLKSWDKFRLPLPFSRGIFIYGDPIYIKEQTIPDILEGQEAPKNSPQGDLQNNSSIEDYRLEVEKQICLIQDKADTLLGVMEK